MIEAQAFSMHNPLAISVGQGRTGTTWRRVPITPSGAALAAALAGLPAVREGWLSLNLWRTGRREEDWAGASGTIVDLDSHAAARTSENTSGKAPPPPAWRAGVQRLIAGGTLPGSVFHHTTNGERVYFAFAELVADRGLYDRAYRGACALVERALRAGDVPLDVKGVTGYQLDPSVSDLAQWFWSPRATVKGTKRNAVPVVLREQPYSAAELAAAAPPDSEPQPARVKAHRSAKSYATMDAARDAFNREHTQDWGKPGVGECPACRHQDCFGRLPKVPSKWCCHSQNHPANVGRPSEDGTKWWGDALDIGAHAAGRTTTEHLRAEGYLAPQPGSDMQERNEATNGAIGTQTPHGDAERLTESGNAERFAREHGSEVRYCRPLKKWLVWDGQRWKPDDSGEAERLAKKTIRGIAAAAAEEEEGSRNKALLSWAIKSESARARAALLQLAQSEEGIPVAPGELDSNPWLLNVGNGTLDLHTGTLRPHEQRDFITRLAPVEYHRDAKCPTWDRFLERVMGGNRELVEFLQRVIGYTLTGEVSAEVLTFHVGTGDNGKSKFVGALQEMLGGYAGSINSELLLTSRNNDGANRATPDVIRLHGLRLAICSETDEGRFLSAAMVKKITSTDKIPARGLHAASTEFRPTHKIFLPTNHRPQVRSADEGTWRRLLLVPWKVRIPPAEQDPDLPKKLHQELPGILAWAVRGCLDWQKRGGGKRGLAAPECVLSATASYRTEEDVIAPFIADRCEQVPEATCAKGAIFAAYQRWATDNNETAISARAFGTRLMELPAISDSKSGGVRFWNGIWLRGAP